MLTHYESYKEGWISKPHNLVIQWGPHFPVDTRITLFAWQDGITATSDNQTEQLAPVSSLQLQNQITSFHWVLVYCKQSSSLWSCCDIPGEIYSGFRDSEVRNSVQNIKSKTLLLKEFWMVKTLYCCDICIKVVIKLSHWTLGAGFSNYRVKYKSVVITGLVQVRWKYYLELQCCATIPCALVSWCVVLLLFALLNLLVLCTHPSLFCHVMLCPLLCLTVLSFVSSVSRWVLLCISCLPVLLCISCVSLCSLLYYLYLTVFSFLSPVLLCLSHSVLLCLNIFCFLVPVFVFLVQVCFLQSFTHLGLVTRFPALASVRHLD